VAPIALGSYLRVTIYWLQSTEMVANNIAKDRVKRCSVCSHEKALSHVEVGNQNVARFIDGRE
jgi:hypothetical protein